ncbi:unnamed protein product [Ostreobium quekettii]|uniref:Uncharacterized protein n=1 Tax=Ostreobium quekettii TaxID=121088 RepID=A0A8S1IMV1_9CHLO|nr:unnamed protein product [Ostreobium quekettii]|eukprot:evm.model.scf_925.1 EVM.evm.TU.scf_925.1   scf_925:9946-11515(-)
MESSNRLSAGSNLTPDAGNCAANTAIIDKSRAPGGCEFGGHGRGVRGSQSHSEPPWDAMLRFWDPSLEADFWASRCTGTRLVFDLVLMAQVLFGTCAMWFMASRTSWSSALLHADMAFTIALRAGALLLAWRHRAEYLSNRSFIVAFLRLQSLVYACRMLSVLPPEGDTAEAVFGHMVQKTIVLPNAVISLGMMLPLREHLFVQGLGCLVSIFWVTGMHCRSWVDAGEGRDAIRNAFGVIGETIEWWVDRATLIGLPGSFRNGGSTSGEQPSCWLVMGSVQVVGVLVIPTMLVYAVEVSLRLKFILDRTADDCERESYVKAWIGSMVVMVWCGIVMSMVGWSGLQAMEELWQQAGWVGLFQEGSFAC